MVVITSSERTRRVAGLLVAHITILIILSVIVTVIVQSLLPSRFNFIVLYAAWLDDDDNDDDDYGPQFCAEKLCKFHAVFPYDPRLTATNHC